MTCALSCFPRCVLTWSPSFQPRVSSLHISWEYWPRWPENSLALSQKQQDGCSG